MAVYKCGSQGPEVRQIQQRLKDLGFYHGPIDGDFGGGTESALKAFQRAQNLTVDGQVGPATWGKLGIGTPAPEPAIKSEPLNVRCLALTGSFETGLPPPDCFAGLSGDFDGQGISLGVCQWNFGQGSLQPLLSEMSRAHADIVDNIFHDYAEEFRHVISVSQQDQLAWTRSIQDARHRIAEPWRGLLKTLARCEEFQAIQAASADRMFKAAAALCRTYQVTSERAFALMFDITVQNGSINDVVKSQIERDFAQLPGAESLAALEVARLRIVANRRAAAGNSQWIEDIRTRKVTIANGEGVVHGRQYSLEDQYGINLTPFATEI